MDSDLGSHEESYCEKGCDDVDGCYFCSPIIANSVDELRALFGILPNSKNEKED